MLPWPVLLEQARPEDTLSCFYVVRTAHNLDFSIQALLDRRKYSRGDPLN